MAAWLQLAPARQAGRGFYACFGCESSDALHAVPADKGGGFRCFSACDRHFSNVDAAAAACGLSPADACRALAEGFGIMVPDPGGASVASTPARAPRAPAPPPQPKPDPEPAAFAEMRAEGLMPRPRSAVYRAVLEETKMTPSGADYLRSRGLKPGYAAAHGFRSLDGPDDWRRLAAALVDSFLPAELEYAGFPPAEPREGRTPPPHGLSLPWGGVEPALLIPYRFGDRVHAFRLRSIDPAAPKSRRYRNLPGAPPAIPFHADSLAGCAGETVHVTEGEIDAWTAAMVCGWRVVGLPGVSTSDAMLARLANALRDAGRVVAWFDNDAGDPSKPDKLPPGEAGYRRLRDALQAAHGPAWVRARMERGELVAKDLNELHVAGDLAPNAWRVG